MDRCHRAQPGEGSQRDPGSNPRRESNATRTIPGRRGRGGRWLGGGLRTWVASVGGVGLGRFGGREQALRGSGGSLGLGLGLGGECRDPRVDGGRDHERGGLGECFAVRSSKDSLRGLGRDLQLDRDRPLPIRGFGGGGGGARARCVLGPGLGSGLREQAANLLIDLSLAGALRRRTPREIDRTQYPEREGSGGDPHAAGR